MQPADLLERRKTHCTLWRPYGNTNSPKLVIGTFQAGNPNLVANRVELPLVTDASTPGLWTLGVRDTGLAVEHRWSEPMGSSTQYAWLEERRDQNSTLEREFLKLLHETGRRLPDRAQYRPEQQVYAEADFYYERDGVPRVCVFCDGPDHDQPNRKGSEERERGRLADLGYRIITIRYDSPLEDQLSPNRDVFGAGSEAVRARVEKA